MNASPECLEQSLAPDYGALQHGPRPLPLFLSIVQRELAGRPDELAIVLKALRAYQEAPRAIVQSRGAAMLQHGKATLASPKFVQADYGPSAIDTVLVPSPINAPSVLDLDADRSLISWLATQGLKPALLDWGKTLLDQGDETLDDYVLAYVTPLLQSIGRPVHLIGYCLGGLIAMAAACHLPVRSLTLIASPWHFEGYGADRRSDLRQLWETSARSCRRLGLVPMELVQNAFWALSSQKLVEKFLRFGAMEKNSADAARFIAIEDWANSGEPLPFRLGEQLFLSFFDQDLPGTGQWVAGNVLIHPGNVLGPAMEFASDRDAIVPLACSPNLANRTILPAGHVGMVIGNRAPELLWTDLKNWLLSNQPC